MNLELIIYQKVETIQLEAITEWRKYGVFIFIGGEELVGNTMNIVAYTLHQVAGLVSRRS